MTRQLTRRIVLLSAVLGTTSLGACSDPTAPFDGGVYGGSGTRSTASGVYGGSGTRSDNGSGTTVNASGVYGGSGTRSDDGSVKASASGVYGGSGTRSDTTSSGG